jgi:hypothetical protein
MRLKKIPLFVLLGAWLAVGPSWSSIEDSSTQAYFAAVKGKVKVLRLTQTKPRNAFEHSKIHEGDRVTTGKKSKATLVMFDGSELEIGPESSMTIAKLEKPSEFEKIIRFKLLVGHLLARVKKLATSSSAFEVEAGGVVCGVRGTVFAVQYIPKTHSLFVNVVEGSVYTQMGQKEVTLIAGQRAHFTHVPTSIPKGQGGGNQGPSSNGKKGTGSNTNGQNNNGTGSGGQNTNSQTSTSSGTGSNNGTSSGTNGGSNGNGGDNSTGGSSNSPTMGSSGGPEGSAPTGLTTNSALGDLNNQFLGGVLINGENNLNQAEQTINIHLVVPPGETVP